MFFFFESDWTQFKPGTVCRVIGRHRHNAGISVVIHKSEPDSCWAYENKPVRFRTNSKGDTVIEFDPACVLSPYRYNDLEITNEIPLQTDGWGAKYRRDRMW